MESSTATNDLLKKKMLTPKETAEFFNVSPRTVYGWIDRGIIGAKTIHNIYRIPSTEAVRLFNESDAE